MTLVCLYAYTRFFFIPFVDKCHWYLIAEMVSASVLCDLIAKLMQNNITSRSVGSVLLVYLTHFMGGRGRAPVSDTVSDS